MVVLNTFTRTYSFFHSSFYNTVPIKPVLFKQFVLGAILGAIFTFFCLSVKSPTSTLIARGVMRSSHAKDNKHNYEIVTRVNSTRILCIVRCSTKKTYIEEVEKTYYFCYSGLNAVAATWAKKCHHSIFLVPLETHPEIKLPVNGEIMNFTEQKSGLDPLLDSLKYAYNEYFDKFDWIFKANDDTFAVIENLKNLLLQYNTAEPLLIGGQSVHYVTPKRRAAGTSYAISKEALKRFVLEAVPDPFCSTSTLPEDIALTACLLSVGVETVNTRDDRGQKKFYPELQSRLYELGQDLVPVEISQQYNRELDSISSEPISLGMASDGKQHYVANAYIYDLSPNNRC